MSKFVYADNAATTKLSAEVLNQMMPYLTEKYGNPSSIYKLGGESKAAIEEARKKVASALGADPSEIFFIGSGTEGDNWAIRGIAHRNQKKGKHIISTKIEHHAVLHTLDALRREGFEITLLDVDEYGMVRLDDLKAAIRPDTILITVMFANNEIGTIQPISEIGKIAREKGIYFMTDAVQAVGHVPINVKDMNIDLLTMSGHKFHGPKGVGAIYIKKGTKLNIFVEGGGQEKGRRAGTENVAGIVGLGAAIEIACANLEENAKKTRTLRDALIKGLTAIPYTRLNGHPTQRLDNNCNISFQFVEGESILLMLDMQGICASSGSACTSGSLDPSHVLLAIGLPHEIAHGSLRLTLNHENTMEDIEYIIGVVTKTIARLREMSPLYEEFIKENK